MGCTLVLYGWYPSRKGEEGSRKFLRVVPTSCPIQEFPHPLVIMLSLYKK